MIFFLLYLIISPVLYLLTLALALFNKKVRVHLLSQIYQYNRFRLIRSEVENKRVVLFHAASSGEFEQLLPVLRDINREDFFIVVSVFSPTVFPIAQSSKIIDHVCYHPFDFIVSAIIFFRNINPSLFIINRHDIWPTHVYIAQWLGIKVLLINGSIHKSLRFHWSLNIFNRWLFQSFSHIFVESDALKKRFAKFVSQEKIAVIGDTRYEQILNRTINNPMSHFSSDIHKTRNIIFGSIVPSDINIIISAISLLYPKGSRSLKDKNHRLIFVPHEISDNIIKVLSSFLQSKFFTPTYYKADNSSFVDNTIIVDRVGILPELYAYSKVAYIGGGFSRGVHNVLEPAIYGNVVCYGPNYSLLNDAEKMKEKNISIVVENDIELSQAISIVDSYEIQVDISAKTKAYAMKDVFPSREIIKFIYENV